MSTRRKKNRWRARITLPRITRDSVLFVFGAIVLIHEVWFTTGQVRTDIVIAALGMMGLPLFLWHGDDESDGAKQKSAATDSRSVGP